MRLIAVLSGGILLLAAGVATAQKVDCEPARCAVQQAITDNCSCDMVRNHGQYVKCVTHLVRQLSRDGTVPINCRGKIVRCAARSVCGKPGFVTCQIPVFGSCDAGACSKGESQLPDGSCTDKTDCLVGTKCKIARSVERCEARGGTVGSSPTCCSDCIVAP
jgi:hypothetical protein